MPTKRILQIVQHLQPGGIETMALDLMERAGPDRDVQILSLEGRKDAAIEGWPRLAKNAERLHFLAKRPGLDQTAVFRLVAILKKQSIDVVHTHHIGPLIYGGIAARLAGLRVVHTEHDAWHLSGARRSKVQSLINKVVKPVFVADANLVALAVKSAIPTIDPIVIHNGVDAEKFAPGDKQAARRRLGLPADRKIIGCAARLEPVKGHSVLLKALSLMPNDVDLVLAGDGSLYQELRAMAAALDIAPRVHFLGRVDDMVTFHQAQDVFCLASEKEGLPLSPLEAQAAGCPVVLTDVGGCGEAVCPDTGYLVPAGSPGRLARKLSIALAETDDADPRPFVLNHRNLKATIAAYEALH